MNYIVNIVYKMEDYITVHHETLKCSYKEHQFVQVKNDYFGDNTIRLPWKEYKGVW